MDAKPGLEIGINSVKSLDDASVSVGLNYVFKSFSLKQDGIEAGFNTQWIEVPVIYSKELDAVTTYN